MPSITIPATKIRKKLLPHTKPIGFLMLALRSTFAKCEGTSQNAWQLTVNIRNCLDTDKGLSDGRKRNCFAEANT